VFVSYHHSVGVGRLTDDRIHRNWPRPSARRYRSQIFPFAFRALFCYGGWLVFYKGRLSSFLRAVNYGIRREAGQKGLAS